MNFDGKGEFTFKNGDWFKGEIKNTNELLRKYFLMRKLRHFKVGNYQLP